MIIRIRYVLLISLIIISGCKFSGKEAPPNVILILVDDMGHGDIAAHGNPILKTPSFDQMHDEAVRFTNFGVSPTCSPTRAALMTGRHEFLSGVTHTLFPMNLLDTAAITIAQLFQYKGYKTGLFGKWHLGQADQYGPWFRGFDESLTVPGDDQNSHFDPVLLQNRVEKKFPGYREDILFREAMNFIRANKKGPFFCYLPTYSPHGPNVAPEKYGKPYEGYVNPERPDGVYSAGFFGQIANIDANLGKLREFLDSLDLEDKTLLIVMNDNGGTRGVDTYNSEMRGLKTTSWRGGTRAYSLWKWGTHFTPGDRDQMSGHIDVLPTLVDLCRLNIPSEAQKQIEGNSLKPVLENFSASLDKSRMQITHIGRWSHPENWSDHKYAGCSVRWDNYILVRNEPCQEKSCNTCRSARRRGAGEVRPLYTNNNDHYLLTIPGEWELFDMESDPHQDHNIATHHPDLVKEMSNYYESWWIRVDSVMTKRWGECN